MSLKFCLADKESRAPPAGARLSDIGGVEDVILDILELISMPLTHPEVYSFTGIQVPRLVTIIYALLLNRILKLIDKRRLATWPTWLW